MLNALVSGPRKTRKLHGYLLASPELIMPDIPFNNPYLSLLGNEED
ncbi:conjugal transfer nickase/helicase domain-containing protein [Saezia sanguinis]